MGTASSIRLHSIIGSQHNFILRCAVDFSFLQFYTTATATAAAVDDLALLIKWNEHKTVVTVIIGYSLLLSPKFIFKNKKIDTHTLAHKHGDTVRICNENGFII